VDKYGTAGQEKDENIILRLRFACCISKAVHTHTQNMQYLWIFHGKKGYAKTPQSSCIIILPALLTLQLEDTKCFRAARCKPCNRWET